MLASVPWLDERDLPQKELKGVAMVALLGTLEEVGFNIRAQVERIWAGMCELEFGVSAAGLLGVECVVVWDTLEIIRHRLLAIAGQVGQGQWLGRLPGLAL